MRHVWLIARHEISTTFTRKAFWLTTFLLPAVVVLLVFLPQFFTDADGDQRVIPGTGSDSRTVGYVDPGGQLHTQPTRLPEGLVRGYDSESQAGAALAAGQIDRYYIISEDYLRSGRLTVVQTRYQPLEALEGMDLIKYVINTGITGDETIAGLLLDPTPSPGSRSLAPSGPSTSDDPAAAYFLPYLLMFVLYMALVMTGGFMLQSVSTEKENRTAEMLLVSLKPKDLMLGKIAGLSAVGLAQVAIWLAVIFGLLLTRGSFAGIDLTLSGGFAARVIPWAIIFFLLGYVMYASVYTTLGVLAPTARDASQFVIIAILPLVVPLVLLSVFSDAPNGIAATVLSLLPLTSPVAMVARLGATPVPWWQLLAGAAALAIVAYLFVLLAGRLFRADNLLSSRPLSRQRLKSALRPQAAAATMAADTTSAGGTRGPTGEDTASRRASRPTRPETSKQRIYLLAAIAAVMVAMGVFEYARGDSSGVIIAIAGLVVGAGAYLRHRRGR